MFFGFVRLFFFFQAEDGIRGVAPSRGLGDVYKRQIERITDANGSISENILTSWEHKNQFIPEIIRFGELKIYLQEPIVKKNDSDVHLSKYEYDILLLLAKSPGRIFGKEMVYDLVWNEPYSGDYNVVMRHICNIREKIEDDPGQPLYIQTVRGVGYRFNGNLGSE